MLALLLPLLLAPAAVAQDESPLEALEPGRLTVVVLDDDGNGIFKARGYIVLTDEEEAAKRKATGRRHNGIDSVSTDPDGYLTLDVPARERRRARVSKSREMKSVTIDVEPIEPGEEREVEVVLTTRPDLEITGTVVRAEDAMPLAGARVHLVEASDNREEEPIVVPIEADSYAATDASGTFTVKARSWLSETVTVSADGRAVKFVLSSRVRDASTLEEPISLARAATLSGTVQAAEGVSLAGASVVAQVAGHELHAVPPPKGTYYGGVADFQFRASIAPDGSFRIPNIPGDVPFELTVEQGGEVILRESSSRRLAAGASAEVVLRILPHSSITGVVLDSDGSAVENVDVWLIEGDGRAAGLFGIYDQSQRATHTISNGTFTFEDVPAGSWKVGLAPLGRRSSVPDAARWAPEYRVVQLSGEPVHEAFTLARGLYLDGRLLLPRGKPIGASENVHAMSGSRLVQSKTNRDGTFRLGPVLPGSWTVYGLAPYVSDGGEGRFLASAAPFKVDAGGEPFDLFLREGACLECSAIDAETGEVVPTTYVAAELGSNLISRRAKARPSVTMTGLVPGEYGVALHAGDGRVAAKTFRLEPMQELAPEPLVLGPGGKVEVVYAGQASFAQIELVAEGMIFDFATGRAGGAPETLRGPVGKAQIRVTTSPLIPTEQQIERTYDVLIKAGETVSVTVAND